MLINHSSFKCFKTGPLTEPGIHQLAKQAHQGARDEPISTVMPVLGLQWLHSTTDLTATSAFHLGAGNPYSGPRTCRVGTLWTKPSSQPEFENVEGVNKLLPGGKYAYLFLSGQDQLETESDLCLVFLICIFTVLHKMKT